jgi:hypothetical protein
MPPKRAGRGETISGENLRPPSTPRLNVFDGPPAC